MYHLTNHFIANVKPASLSSKKTNMNNKPAINLNITDFKSSIRAFNYSCIIYLQENIERVNTKLCYKRMDGFAFAQKKAKTIMKEQCIIISQFKKENSLNSSEKQYIGYWFIVYNWYSLTMFVSCGTSHEILHCSVT